ncbi:hypothetical protein SBA6_840002 [Candidatus Sulfopaludibacter sp. SbA6]|nr:hypothetical protein SBA6_840002 [Candidatus Sulfopaludibacter sp. SbA6]
MPSPVSRNADYQSEPVQGRTSSDPKRQAGTIPGILYAKTVFVLGTAAFRVEGDAQFPL